MATSKPGGASTSQTSGLMKALPWIVIAIAVVAIGFLLFKPASGGAPSGIRKVDSAAAVPTSGKPVFIEFYTPT